MLQFLNNHDFPMQILVALIGKAFNFHPYLQKKFMQKGALPAAIELVSAA